jgi:puromycin-sensitive aminopeptidase
VTTTLNPYRLSRIAVPNAYRIHLTPDLEDASFGGRVEIDLDLTEPSSEMTLNAIELDIIDASVTAGSRTLAATDIALDSTYETATFRFDGVVPSGPITVVINFTGILNDQLHGFYRSTYTDDGGHEHLIATTQFEASDARRAFPCFDEPSLKATFQVSLTIPSELAAYSNSRETSAEDHGDGRRTIAFAPTMKMSTYLVAFVVGPFEATEPVDVGGVPLRTIFPRGKGHLAPWSLEVAEHALRYFATYFDLAYPGDKFDMIAIPDFAAGAMENLGLVTFRESDLLIDPERASFAQIERVALVVNHETAHMWFGDLVTMDWWEGIWLNEAFATFMESICTDDFRPGWQKWVGFNPMKDLAFSVDSLHSTRPIEYEVVSPDDCRGMFDVLTYMKGCSVLRMLEQYLGAETFRDGIRLYLRRHAYGNTVTADLWAALEEVSGRPVGQIMDTWILQGGFPLVSVRDGQISQQPFRYSDPGADSNIGEIWQVPVLSRSLGVGEATRQLLGASPAPLESSGTAIVNAGGSGFYRVAYGPSEVAAISARLGELSVIERAGLFSDTWESTLVGRSTITDLLNLAGSMGDLDEPSVWTVVLQALRMTQRLVDDDGDDVLAEVAQRLARPQLERLTWDPREGDSELAGQLRGIIVELLGSIGRDPEVIAEVLRRFDAGEVVGDLAAAIAQITAQQDRPGDMATFEARRNAAPNPQEEQIYLFAPAANPNTEVLGAHFDRCFSEFRTQDAAYLIGTMIRNRHGGPAIWRRLTERWDEAIARFPVGTPANALGSLATLISDPQLAREVREFHTSHPLDAGQRSVNQALERMDVGVAFGERVRDRLVDQLKAVR